MRLSTYTSAGSSAVPLSVSSWMVAPTRSTNDSAPGSVQVNAIVVVVAKVVSLVVRSSSTV